MIKVCGLLKNAYHAASVDVRRYVNLAVKIHLLSGGRAMSGWKQAFGLVLAYVVAWTATCSLARGDEKYPSARAAVAEANVFMRKRDYKSAQAPLEAALKLAPDDAYRLRIYNNLMACYRLLPETDKMVEASEFTILKTKENSERSLTAGSLTSFMFQRGKLDETRKTYEGRLANDPDDLLALAMLTAIHQVHFDDREKSAAYRVRLDKVEQKRSGKLAEDEETLAGTNADQATDHWKQAAVYWNRAGESAKALKAAKQAEATGPEKRSEMLLHFWHVHLGDVYFSANSYQDAIRHFEQAIKTTKIDGYKKTCEQKLADAKAKLSAQGI
jgi:tetratricopeptide (TPR) repeat protein